MKKKTYFKLKKQNLFQIIKAKHILSYKNKTNYKNNR